VHLGRLAALEATGEQRLASGAILELDTALTEELTARTAAAVGLEHTASEGVVRSHSGIAFLSAWSWASGSERELGKNDE
jgi:hypothetical protein